MSDDLTAVNGLARKSGRRSNRCRQQQIVCLFPELGRGKTCSSAEECPVKSALGLAGGFRFEGWGTLGRGGTEAGNTLFNEVGEEGVFSAEGLVTRPAVSQAKLQLVGLGREEW